MCVPFWPFAGVYYDGKLVGKVRKEKMKVVNVWDGHRWVQVPAAALPPIAGSGGYWELQVDQPANHGGYWQLEPAVPAVAPYPNYPPAGGYAQVADASKINEAQDMKPADNDPNRFYWCREVDGQWTQRSRMMIDDKDFGPFRWYAVEGKFYCKRL